MKENIKVLAVKQPWASLIAEGKKTIEVRSMPTNIRGRVAIYASLSSFDTGLLNKIPATDPFLKGHIIATVEIVDCKQYVRNHEFMHDRNKHLIPPDEIKNYSCGYGWLLCNAQNLAEPIEYKMPKGCVVWANAEI